MANHKLSVDNSASNQSLKFGEDIEEWLDWFRGSNATFYGGTPDMVGGKTYYANGSQILHRFTERDWNKGKVVKTDYVALVEGKDLARDALHHGASFGDGISGNITALTFGEWGSSASGKKGTGADGRVNGLDVWFTIQGLDLSAEPGDGEDPSSNPVYALYNSLLDADERAFKDQISSYDFDIQGTKVDDEIYSYDGDDTLVGGKGDDRIYGRDGDDTLLGGAGDDNLNGNRGNDSLVGGDGGDRLYGGKGDDTLKGRGGGDSFRPSSGHDVVYGGKGDDYFYGGEGRDEFHGEGGADHFEIEFEDDSADRVIIHDFDVSKESIELRYFGKIVNNRHTDSLILKDTEDGAVLKMHKSKLTLMGVQVDELNIGAPQPDEVYGRIFQVRDIYGYELKPAPVDGTAGNDSMTGTDKDDELFGQDGADTIKGGPGDDALYGGFGSDMINGNSGGDSLYGGPGDDTLDGGSYGLFNRDWLWGGAGDDVLKNASSQEGGDGNDRLTGTENTDYLLGGQGKDTLTGGKGQDFLEGEGGDDRLYGGNQSDALYGGRGDDTLRGDGGNDDLWGERGKDYLKGDDGDDTLNGGSDNDTIRGGDGKDRIEDGKGDDLMFGGGGRDTFLFDYDHYYANARGANVIGDFNPDHDRIKIWSYEVTRFKDLKIKDAGEDARIVIANDLSIILTGIEAGDVSRDMFDF
ncbi:MAG: calcium-binding protein [Pseudomonadota bacterium]